MDIAWQGQKISRQLFKTKTYVRSLYSIVGKYGNIWKSDFNWAQVERPHVHKLARGISLENVTTTTHMYVEADTDLSCDFFALRDKIIKDGYCMAGQKISEQSKPKMCGLPYDLLDRLIKDMPQALDYVIIEADGAKHHSLKYPAADEPVVYPLTTDVIIVLGTWEKGKLCKDVVFRYELMQNELGMAEDVVVDDSVIDTLCQVYVKKLRDSGFEGRISTYYR